MALCPVTVGVRYFGHRPAFNSLRQYAIDRTQSSSVCPVAIYCRSRPPFTAGLPSVKAVQVYQQTSVKAVQVYQNLALSHLTYGPLVFRLLGHQCGLLRHMRLKVLTESCGTPEAHGEP